MVTNGVSCGDWLVTTQRASWTGAGRGHQGQAQENIQGNTNILN